MSKKSLGIVPFALGFILALIVGWFGFPQVLYSEKDQPINFNHPLHVEDQGLTCDYCHTYRDDGSYDGLPSLASCMDCHIDVMDPDNPNDVKLIEEYVYKEKEIPWYVYNYQPDNVYFSHIAHQDFECTECHPDVSTMETLPPYKENRLTKYSKYTYENMKMYVCERCHAQNGASNACFICHK